MENKSVEPSEIPPTEMGNEPQCNQPETKKRKLDTTSETVEDEDRGDKEETNKGTVNTTDETVEDKDRDHEQAAIEETKYDPSAVRKKKVALLLSYCGDGYYGMQKNPDVNTIEEELLQALWKAGGIKEDVKDDLAKLSFQRCARTDKGVSAARQVVSLKMVPDREMIALTNQHLPPPIRVMGIKRVTRGFDCKLSCASRSYEYLLPTFALAPTFHETRKDYRIKDAVLDRVKEVLHAYEGTHNFHNFTSGRLPTDASSTRYIIQFKAGLPFVRDGHEFVCLSVKGQSFMLHQIRKMIGLCIAISKGYCDIETIQRSWQPGKLDIPRAPGLGLVLDRVHYTGYNKKYGSDGIHEPITWDENEEEVLTFKEKYIWSAIINTEVTHCPMMRWLGTLKCHTYTDERTMMRGGIASRSTEQHDDTGDPVVMATTELIHQNDGLQEHIHLHDHTVLPSIN